MWGFQGYWLISLPMNLREFTIPRYWTNVPTTDSTSEGIIMAVYWNFKRPRKPTNLFEIGHTTTEEAFTRSFLPDLFLDLQLQQKETSAAQIRHSQWEFEFGYPPSSDAWWKTITNTEIKTQMNQILEWHSRKWPRLATLCGSCAGPFVILITKITKS